MDLVDDRSLCKDRQGNLKSFPFVVLSAKSVAGDVEMQTWFQSGRTRRNLVLFFSWALLMGGPAALGATPHWISAASEDGKSQRLSKTFSIEESVRGAELKLAA